MAASAKGELACVWLDLRNKRTEIFASVDRFYRKFYFRPRKLFAIGGEMLRDRTVLRRRLAEGREFLSFLASRRQPAAP